MQKKFTPLFLLCLGLIAGDTTFSQVILSEGFESAVEPLPPSGWVVSNTGNANWKSLFGGEGGNQYEGDQCMYLDGSFYGDQADAWLIGPSFEMTAGKKYSISLYCKNQFTAKNIIQVTLGDDATPASQTEQIGFSSFTSISYIKLQINYTATQSGIKHLGVHCVTPKTSTYAYVDNIQVEEVTCFEPVNPVVDLNSITSTGATASWGKAGGTSFEWGVTKSATKPPTRIFSTTENTASITNLSAATQYYFYVRSTCGEGASSNWAVTGFASAYDTAGIAVLNCGEKFENNFHGNYGVYNIALCGSENYGKEFFHKFIPATSGYYKLDQLSVNSGQTAVFAYKDAAEGIGPAGWTCIGSGFGSALKYTFGPLVAGKEYYIQEKMQRPVAFPTSYSYYIECYEAPPANDDCSNATNITATSYDASCTGTPLTTLGATSQQLKGGFRSCGGTDGTADDDIWVKFKATDDAQLFRFSNVDYLNPLYPHINTGIYFNIYSKPCDLSSIVDCGLITLPAKGKTEIYSYLLQKDSSYYVRLFTADISTYISFNMCIMDLDVSKGIANQCTQGLPFTINNDYGNKNTTKWVPLTDANYKRMATINANSNNLNEVNSSVYINKAAVRSAGGVYYLDRNFTLQSAQAPGKKVAVRLYISNAELNKLIAQAGSGVSSISDLKITQNDDNCATAFTSAATNFIKQSASGDYGTDSKYIEFTTDHLSSFYLHAGNKPLTAGAVGSMLADNLIAKNNKAGVYPNPFINSFTLSVNEKQTTKLAVSILDMKGNTVKVISKTVDAGFTQIHIEAANLALGLYTLKIQKNSTVEYIKVIKQ